LENPKIKTNSKKAYFVIKRVQDLFFSLLALIVLFPVLLIIAVLIVIDSPGASPIFIQERVGKDGKTFKLYKFRSMCPNAEEKLSDLLDKNEMDGPVFKIGNDPRITRVGRIIRKVNVDELPQLINIIKGEMSIIGPRPALPKEVAQYSDFDRKRLAVRPGLSCYWQIENNKNNISFSDWMKLDVKYIEEMNFIIDWKIIFKSIVVSLKGVGV